MFSRNLKRKKMWSFRAWRVWLESMECMEMAKPNPKKVSTGIKIHWNMIDGIRGPTYSIC